MASLAEIGEAENRPARRAAVAGRVHALPADAPDRKDAPEITLRVNPSPRAAGRRFRYRIERVEISGGRVGTTVVDMKKACREVAGRRSGKERESIVIHSEKRGAKAVPDS